MSVNSVLGSGLQGIQNGFSKANKAADNIAKLNQSANPAESITESAISLMEGKTQVQASSKVIETVNATIGSLIDIQV